MLTIPIINNQYKPSLISAQKLYNSSFDIKYMMLIIISKNNITFK